MSSTLSTIFELAIVLGIMVLVHEFGHFAVAKLCGIRVEVFSIGFGKRLFGIKRGDTDYCLSIIPLGGYVKMAGETNGVTTDNITGDPGEFNSHPRWQRIAVALAGPVANFILAFGLMIGVYMLHNEVSEYLSNAATTDYISPNSLAASTGIHSGDTIVHFNDVENPTWEQLFNQAALNLNQTVPFAYTHDGQRINTSIALTTKETPETFSPDTLGFVPRMQQNGVEVSVTQPNTPAAQAGLQSKDQIVSIDGLAIHSVPALLAYMQDQKGKPATLSILRSGQTMALPITPALLDAGDGTKSYRLGFESTRSPRRSKVGCAGSPSPRPSKPHGPSTKTSRSSSVTSSVACSLITSRCVRSPAPSASARSSIKPSRCPAGCPSSAPWPTSASTSAS